MKKKLIILFFLIPFLGTTQNFADKTFYLIDSLDLDDLTKGDKELIDNSLKLFHSTKDDTLKIQSLSSICENMMHDDWEKYQYYQYSLIKNSLSKNTSKKESLTLKKSLASALNNLGFIHMNNGDIDSALFYNHKCLEVRKELNDKKGLAILYNNFGGIYKNQGDIALALNYFHKGLKIQEELSDIRGAAVSLNNIGQIYKIQKDLDLALEYYQKSLEIRISNKDKLGMSGSYNNIAGVFQAKNDLEKALEYCFKGLNISIEIGDKRGMASSYNNIGYIYKILGNKSLNEEYWLKSIKIREEIGDKEGASSSYNNIGLDNYQNSEFAKARTMAEKGLQLAKEIGFPSLIERNAGLLSLIATKQGKYKEAFEMRNLEIQMRDSIASEENIRAAAQQQAKYEYEKEQAINDKEHEKQLAIEKEAKAKQKIITYATASGLGLVGIFLFFVINRLNVTRRQKGIIELAHTELEEKNKEITDSIQYAKRIQNAILPPNKLVKEYLQESFILYKPKDIVAGDFYWLELKDNKILFAAADCTGHGVPGAMVSVICNNGLNRSVREHGLTDPGEILNKTREIVISEFEKSEDEVKDGMDIALCSLEGNVLKYAGANNPLWIIRKNATQIEEVKANKQPIGKYSENLAFTTHTIELQKGDSVYIFSDGYSDQFGGEKGKKMKAANFKKLLLSIQNETIEKQKQLIDEAFEEWKGDLEQLDDVCVIGIKA
ncbi:tetratricopeptide repeat protein [Vicingus serpentipes]|uniref:Tetratricopeptide repeat protein n=1 Tax=Vicingus serpentipes TaxID=1926625 RepID=A0A5C6RQT8_9FLAO|nr:tetratricopeptide repeat protein [Vicingus serpentipes]TXB64603.1 tetratricopeptide repeat protein [Vicingus serpentipes]